MKMRKLFAGLAAAATLLGGLAIGASTASAADDDSVVKNQKVTLTEDANTNITITGSAAALSNHTFKYVRIGTYTYAVTSASSTADHITVAGVSVETDPAAKQYLNTVLGAVDPDYKNSSEYYDANPAGYIAKNMNDSGADAKPQWSGTLRNLVTELANNPLFKQAQGTEATALALQGDDQSFSQTVSQGLYVVVDVTDNQAPSDDVNGNEGKYRASIPMVVGTKIVGQVADHAGDYDFESGVLGKINVKNDRPTIDKSITGVTDNTSEKDVDGAVASDGLAARAAIGDVIHYQIGNVEIPSTVGYDTVKFPYVFKITDTLHSGQTFNNDVTVFVDKNDNGKFDNGEELKGSPYQANPAGYDYVLTSNPSNGGTSIAVDLSKYVGGYSTDNTSLVQGSAAGLDPDLIGKRIFVTYTATLNDDAVVNPDGSNDNGVKLEYSNNPGQHSQGTVTPPDTQVFTGKFSLKKVNKQGVSLAGAKFKVTKNSKTVKFLCQNGDCKVSEKAENASAAVGEVEVGADGVLHLSGLEGTYTVEETKAPDNYSSLFLPKFEVTVTTTPQKLDSLTDNKWYGAGTTGSSADQVATKTVVTVSKQDIWKLTSDELVEGNVQVTNVTSVTQLPKTGAAGIMLFGVVGLLLAGAATLVYTESRATKRALRHA